MLKFSLHTGVVSSFIMVTVESFLDRRGIFDEGKVHSEGLLETGEGGGRVGCVRGECREKGGVSERMKDEAEKDAIKSKSTVLIYSGVQFGSS